MPVLLACVLLALTAGIAIPVTALLPLDAWMKYVVSYSHRCMILYDEPFSTELSTPSQQAFTIDL